MINQKADQRHEYVNEEKDCRPQSAKALKEDCQAASHRSLVLLGYNKDFNAFDDEERVNGHYAFEVQVETEDFPDRLLNSLTVPIQD